MKSAEKFIQEIARTAGDAVLRRFGKDKEAYRKSAHPMDTVTKADLLSEKIIMTAIKKRYPDHGIISEESGRMNDTAEYVWIIDPIDGTFNFASGVPLFGIMICLTHRGRVILSAIDLPAMGELFYAKAGGGAYVNGKRIHCARMKDFGHSGGYGSNSLRDRTGKFLRNLMVVAQGKHMMLGSLGSICANACYVAAGRRDWMAGLLGQIHDFAPVSLILKEAGCTVTDTKGKPWKLGVNEMIAANPHLHKHLLKVVKGI